MNAPKVDPIEKIIKLANAGKSATVKQVIDATDELAALRARVQELETENYAVKKELAQILYNKFFLDESLGDDEADEISAKFWEAWEDVVKAAQS